MYATNKENYVADTGEWRGTQINSSNMLWSLSGNLSITFRLLMGINYNAESITFRPFVPKNLKADRKVENFKYRNATLDISVSGYGDSIKSFKLDGTETADATVSGELTGHHTVEIVMSDSFRQNLQINHQKPCWAPKVTLVNLEDGWFDWNAINDIDHYEVFAGGKKVYESKERGCDMLPEWKGDVQLVSVTADGVRSFPTEPHNLNRKVVKDFAETMLTKKSGKEFSITVEVPADGVWTLSWKYANATGPVTTDNNCGIRMLYVDGQKIGINVFPQRGEDNWDEWGWTNPEKLNLKAGKHTLTLRMESDADNMDIDINDFKIKSLRLTEL